MAKNDSSLIYNEAKVAEGKDLLAGIRKAFIDVDNYIYDAVNNVKTAKGVDLVLNADYSIDLKKPTDLVDQSRTDLKQIIDTLDENMRMIDKIMNPQEDTANAPINNGNNGTNVENDNKEETYTKNQLLGIEDTPKDDEQITEKVTGVDPTTEATKNIENVKDETPVVNPNNNEETTVVNPNPTNAPIVNPQPTISPEATPQPQPQPQQQTEVVTPAPTNDYVEPVPEENPIINNPEPVYVNPAPAPVAPAPQPQPQPQPQQQTVVVTPAPTSAPVSTTPTVTSAPKTDSTTTKVTTPKIGNKDMGNVIVPPSSNRDGNNGTSTITNNRVKTDTKKESYVATRHDNGINKTAIAGAIGGAALLGAVGIGVAASATKKKKEKDTDESFNNNNTYYPTDENYNPN